MYNKTIERKTRNFHFVKLLHILNSETNEIVNYLKEQHILKMREKIG